MVSNFKFLEIKKPLRTELAVLKLKGLNNRNEFMTIKWSEYPKQDVELKEFRGNIFEFFILINRIKIHRRHSTNSTRLECPTVYEIYGFKSGYQRMMLVLSNHLRHSNFISRAFKLKIIYSV